MNRRLAAIVALGFLPWTLVFARNYLTLIFSFGLVYPPAHLTDIVSYLTVYTTVIPGYLRSWPIGVGIYLLALASALSGVLFDREDRRVTALLLVLVGLTQLSVAWGFTRRVHYFAVPVGTVFSWTVVWWFDWETLRTLAPASS